VKYQFRDATKMILRRPQQHRRVKMENAKIAAAFVKSKKAFAPAMKTSTNPHFKSKYADLAACVEAVDDSFLANGIVMYQETFEDLQGVTVETVLLHESGESLRCGKLHVPAPKNDPQGYGSALSYARRYSLMAACGLAPEDDDANAASKPRPTLVQPSKPAWTSLHEAILVQYREAAMQGMDAVKELHAALPKSEEKAHVWLTHGDSIKSAAQKAA
jgi:hypothetical protein